MPRMILLTFLATLTMGCIVVNTPITGTLYNRSMGATTVGTGDAGSKTGTACSKGVFGVVLGDSSIEAAKAAGNITKVAYVDHKVLSVLFVYAQYCTIVHGD